MAQGPTGRSAVDAAELERLRAKLDGFEAMGLQVGLLRELLSERAGLAAKDAFPFPATRCDRVVAAVLARIGQIHAS